MTHLKQNLAFYIAVPFLIGAVLGLQRAGAGLLLGVWGSLGFWLLSVFVAWIMNDIATRGVAYLLRPFGTPLWLVLLFGVLLGNVLNLPTYEWRMRLLLNDEQIAQAGIVLPSLTVEYAVLTMRSIAVGAALWLGANYLFLLAFGMPRYGYGSGADGKALQQLDGTELEDLGQGLGVGPPSDVIALQAQQHYVKVFTSSGSKLIYNRFSDAMRALNAVPGCQVHRSYWVSKTAITEVERDGAAYRLILINGEKIPVSRTYLLNLRNLGVLKDA